MWACSSVVDLPVFTKGASPLAGFFTQISTLADVQENVMEYLHVLSRPKVIDQEHDVVWTEAYIDSTVSTWGLQGTDSLRVPLGIGEYPWVYSESWWLYCFSSITGSMTSFFSYSLHWSVGK